MRNDLNRPAKWAVVAMAAAALALPASAAPLAKARKPKLEVDDRLRAAPLGSYSPGSFDTSRFAFTLPGQGPAAQRVATLERAFRFTPSGKSDRKSVQLGVTSRVVAPTGINTTADSPRASVSPAAVEATAPAGYAMDLSVGWLGFAVTGGASRIDSGLLGGRREAVDLGLSYRTRNWRTSLQVGSETGPLRFDAVTPEKRLSYEFGGAYALSPSMQVQGGLRYRAAPTNPSLLTPAREDGAVYVGTAVSF